MDGPGIRLILAAIPIPLEAHRGDCVKNSLASDLT
jgi:hypothetical protein